MKIFFATVSLIAFTASAIPAYAQTAQDNVVSLGSQKVVSTSGACVRTKWDAPNDACGVAKPEPVAAPTPAPAPAPARALGSEQRTLYFDFNKADLTAAAKTKLDVMSQAINASKEVTQASVIGYTDVIGSDGYNQALSEKRAAAVRDYLAARISVPTSSAVVKGAGKSTTADCPKSLPRKKRIECLASDRKVEVEIHFAK